MMRTFATTLLTAALAAASAADARADDVAPALELDGLKNRAREAFAKVFDGLPPNDKKRLAGAYLAFDPNPSELIGQVACDDDGDYVVVLSDAMLRLASNIARAQSFDDANGTRKIEDYAGFVTRTQVPGTKLLPLQPGFFIAMKPKATYEQHLRSALAFLVTRELVHFRAGDATCPHPTATKEAGDDEWTAAEQRRASELAASVYPGRGFERDHEAATRALDAGFQVDGMIGFVRFFVQVHAEQVVAVSRWQPLYQVQHPSALMRLSAVRRAEENHTDL